MILLVFTAVMILATACQTAGGLSLQFSPIVEKVNGRFVPTIGPTNTYTATVTNTFEPSATPTLTLTPTSTATQTATAQPTRTTAPTQKVVSTSAPAASTSGCSGGDTSVEANVLSMINSQRSSAGLSSLSNSSSLAETARNYSRSMAQNGFFEHGDIWGRVNASGAYSAVGEILYAGSGSLNSPSNAVSAWLNSSNHREMMLSSRYTMAGVGYWCDPNSTYGGYYTVDFATP